MTDSLLNGFGFSLVFEANNIAISMLWVFVGKGYVCDGVFKLSINNTNNVATYLCDSFS